ncbi:MAG: leucine-rich repeat protein [Bacilli bacterium]|nr:leucine-rich repeat protein [Bacilli bacterium]
MKKKKVVLPSIILGILVITLGITYAVFSYQEESLRNSELITGDIYMYYNETSKTINISNLMPNKEYSETDYFEFKVSGKNTYNKKNIYYEIVLDNGEYEGSDLNRTIPIDSQLLKFKLVEVNGDLETEIFSDRTYSDITNKRIWVDTIGSDDGNYSKTYRLYVRIAEYTNICGGEVTDGCDYYINPSEEYANLDWNKLYASIKVNVKGDLEEKSIETDATCFGYDIEYEGVSYTKTIEAVYDLNSNLTEEQLDICASYLLQSIGIEPGSYDKETDENYLGMKSLCNGETIQEFTFKTFTNQLSSLGLTLDYNYLQDEGIISNYQGIDKYINLDTSEELDINAIDKNNASITLTSYNLTTGGVDVIIPEKINDINVTVLQGKLKYEIYEPIFYDVENIVIPNTITTIGSRAFYENKLTSVVIPNSVTTIGSYAFYGNKLTSVVIPDSVTTIGNRAFSNNQLTSVEIPNSVTVIEDYAFYGNKLTSVEIPNSVTAIGSEAFRGNQLTSVVIPNSVITIDSSAFCDNQLTNVTFEKNSKLESIYYNAFYGPNHTITEVTIPDSVTYLSCNAFNDDVIINKSDNLTCS